MAVKYSVKDKNNLLTHNQWACGEPLNNLDGFTYTYGPTHYRITDEYKQIGNKSIELTQFDKNMNVWLVLEINLSNEYIGQTLTFESYVYNKNVDITRLKLFSNNSEISSINLPISQGFQLYSMSFTYTNPVIFRFINYGSESGQKLYVDNLRLYSQ